MFFNDAEVVPWEKDRRRKMESEWPEYKTTSTLLETPARTLDAAGEKQNYSRDEASLLMRLRRGKQWLRTYLGEHVQRIQELKQHHVHIWDEEKKEYVVLEHCKARDKKNTCKSHFPRTKWLIKQCVVLCRGLLQLGLHSSPS